MQKRRVKLILRLTYSYYQPSISSLSFCVLTLVGFTQRWDYDFQELWGAFLLLNVQVEWVSLS